MLVTQAVAATSGERTGARKATRTAATHHTPLTLEARLTLKIDAVRKHRSVIRFFDVHRWLLHSAKHGPIAHAALRRATRRLPKATKELVYYTRLIRKRDAQLRLRRLAKAPPRTAICGVFGRYCREALSVARCESHLSTRAQNGQYLGLFQMGSSERRLFGHGNTPHRQAVAAHRYFVLSGRDWSPWSCRWAIR